MLTDNNYIGTRDAAMTDPTAIRKVQMQSDLRSGRKAPSPSTAHLVRARRRDIRRTR
jgi:hypothetical protein